MNWYIYTVSHFQDSDSFFISLVTVTIESANKAVLLLLIFGKYFVQISATVIMAIFQTFTLSNVSHCTVFVMGW